MAVFQTKPSQKPHKNFCAYYRKDLTQIRYKCRKPPAVTIYRGNFAPKKFTGKEQDQETGLYYFGARYLDPKTSRWLSTDPALGDYLPVAPNSDDAKKHNQNLPGMGGVFNVVNLHVYHYAGNNPVKYVDPDGRDIDYAFDSGAVYRTEEEAISATQDFVIKNYKGDGMEFGGFIYSKDTDDGKQYGVRLVKGTETARVEYSLDRDLQDKETAVIDIHSHPGPDIVIKKAINERRIPDGALVAAQYRGIVPGETATGRYAEGFSYHISCRSIKYGDVRAIASHSERLSDSDLNRRISQSSRLGLKYMVISPSTRDIINYTNFK